MKKILILVTHSLGELDVLFPLILQAKKLEQSSFTIIITVRNIFQKYNDNEFYRYCANKIGVRVLFCQLPNKFDPGFRLLRRLIRFRSLVSLAQDLYLISKVPLIFYRLWEANYFMHEVTNQWSSTKMMYWFRGRPIFSYMHGHGITASTVFNNKVSRAQDVTYLNFHEHNRVAIEKMGLLNQVIVGYPKLSRDWNQLVRSYRPSTPIVKNAIVIFTRSINATYMSEKNYFALLSASFNAIRQTLGEVPIVVKMHPREDEHVGARIMREVGFDRQTSVSTEHAAILARDALATITFWGSTVFDGLCMNKPTIEFFVEGPDFRKSEPRGSAYKEMGFHSVSNQSQLERILERVAQGTYRESTALDELRDPPGAQVAFWRM